MTLLLGSSGQLGTALNRLLTDADAPPRGRLDLARLTHDRVREIVGATTPDVVINCAAYTAVDHAEADFEQAETVNGRAVGVLAEVTAEAGIPFVTFSTDYVFDGRSRRPYVESDLTHPINAYGRSKLVGEQLALAANPRSLVIRTSWVISGTHPNFVATMLRLAAEGRELSVVDDQHGCPTVAADLARAALEAIGSGASGLLHMTNQGQTTWFELAREAVRLGGHDESAIRPCSSADYPTPAARPAYSVLDSERRDSLGLAPLPPWTDSLPSVVNAIARGP
jgi:dTDP-4-dehydrorhamnose reductase